MNNRQPVTGNGGRIVTGLSFGVKFDSLQLIMHSNQFNCDSLTNLMPPVVPVLVIAKANDL